MVQRILIPTDFSESTFEGIRYVATELGTRPIRCTLLHVVPHMDTDVPGQAADGTAIEPVELALQKLRQMIDRFTLPAWMDIDTAVRFGEPWKEIMRFASDLKMDLIIASPEPDAGIAERSPERSTDLIARFSPVPVLMLKPGSFTGSPIPWEEIRQQMHIHLDSEEK